MFRRQGIYATKLCRTLAFIPCHVSAVSSATTGLVMPFVWDGNWLGTGLLIEDGGSAKLPSTFRQQAPGVRINWATLRRCLAAPWGTGW